MPTVRLFFVTTYSLPNLSNAIKKYFPILTATKRGKEAFKDPPLLAYRRPKNLRDFLVKAKLKNPSRANRTLSGTISRCNDSRCRTCKFISHGPSSCTFYNTGEQRKIIQNLSHSSDNLVYLINCKRCIKHDPTLPCQYTGQTSQTPTNQFLFTLIRMPHINNNRDSIRRSMEQHLIERAGTLKNGINWTCDH